MGTQRNFTKSLIREFFTFQHLHRYNLHPYRQHNHLGFDLIPVVCHFHFHFHSHSHFHFHFILSFLFQQMGHRRQHRIRFIVIPHRHHLLSEEMEFSLSLPIFCPLLREQDFVVLRFVHEQLRI
jgi:hypothetical protein